MEKQEILLKKYTAQNNKTRIDFVKKIVCAYYGYPVTFLNTSSRRRNNIHVKQICIYIVKALLSKRYKMSLNDIGAEFYGSKGLGMDHASVLHSARTVAGYLEHDKELSREVSEIQDLLKTRMNILDDEELVDNDYYFIDFDKVITARVNEVKGKTISFTGFTAGEIKTILQNLNCEEPRLHENTGLFIMVKK